MQELEKEKLLQSQERKKLINHGNKEFKNEKKS